MIPQMQDRDGFSEEELQAALNEFSADTCSTMFGRLSGLATRLMERFCNLVARKCGNHKGALAASHGCHAIPYLKNHYLPTLKTMGIQMDASNKKGTFVDEANVEYGTKTKKIGKSAFTRWGSVAFQILKLVLPANFMTTLMVFFRAGEGGASEDFYEDAGRADATSAGCAKKVGTREFFALTQALGDLLPPLVKAGEKLQKWDLDHATYKEAVGGAIEHLKGCLSDPATHCPNLHNWKSKADEADAIGPTLRSTSGRSDAWIDTQIRMLIESLLVQHEDYFKEDEYTESLNHLFDIHRPAVPIGNATDAAVTAFYKKPLQVVIDRYTGLGEHTFLKEPQLKMEWQSFIRGYISRAREFQKKWLGGENPKRAADHAAKLLKVKRKRSAEQKANVPAADQTPLPLPFVPLTAAPLREIIGHAYSREAQLPEGDCAKKPLIAWLLATWLTMMFSQAPIESNFSQMKLTKVCQPTIVLFLGGCSGWFLLLLLLLLLQ